MIKILQFLAQFRAPSPPPPRCHLTLTTVQLPYQRQSTFPPHYPRPVSQPASAALSTKSTIHCESKARESEREREQQEREQKEGGRRHKEIKREVLSRSERGAGCTWRTELTLMLPPSPSLSASRRLLFGPSTRRRHILATSFCLPQPQPKIAHYPFLFYHQFYYAQSKEAQPKFDVAVAVAVAALSLSLPKPAAAGAAAT